MTTANKGKGKGLTSWAPSLGPRPGRRRTRPRLALLARTCASLEHLPYDAALVRRLVNGWGNR
jgi:hypothetical protein